MPTTKQNQEQLKRAMFGDVEQEPINSPAVFSRMDNLLKELKSKYNSKLTELDKVYKFQDELLNSNPSIKKILMNENTYFPLPVLTEFKIKIKDHLGVIEQLTTDRKNPKYNQVAISMLCVEYLGFLKEAMAELEIDMDTFEYYHDRYKIIKQVYAHKPNEDVLNNPTCCVVLVADAIEENDINYDLSKKTKGKNKKTSKAKSPSATLPLEDVANLVKEGVAGVKMSRAELRSKMF